MGDQLIFKTEFVNETSTPWDVRNGSMPLITVPPHSKSAVESFKPTFQWSRWRRVIKKVHDQFNVEENPAWLNPYEAEWYLELYNEHGSSIQSIRLADGCPMANGQGFVHVMKGIPMTVPMRSLEDQNIYFRRIHWTKERIKVPIGKTDYFTWDERVATVKEPRSDDDIAKIVLARAEAVRKAMLKQAEDQAIKIAEEAAKATARREE